MVTGIRKSSLVQGCIDEIRGNILHGWVFSAISPLTPVLFVDDTPAGLIADNLPRPDVAKSLGITDNVGFTFRLPAVRDTSILTLYGVGPQETYIVRRQKTDIAVWDSNFITQMEKATEIARNNDSVAIVCWDGAHNPVGRAKVLYDIVDSRRPAVLFCYLHKEFGGDLWPPLVNSDIALVTIPWEKRRTYQTLINRYKIQFDTVWICKPRLPSFMLAVAVSHANTRFILDIDDDEEAFIKKENQPAAYNIPGMGLANALMEQLSSRTVVSPSLQQRFGGHIVRHVRKVQNISRESTSNIKKIAFIGTVRPHKNILSIAKALNLFKFSYNLPVEFHVYGDIQPPELREELLAHAVVVGDMISASSLPKQLASMDAVITGFPLSDEDDISKDILASQVSAKISDALAAGLPVLTPATPAVADLHNVPGVYLFTENNFIDQLVAALRHSTKISLPEDFTLNEAYRVFERVEAQACKLPIFKHFLPDLRCNEGSDAPALILLWKQHDAGLYGRRVDQIARSYKRSFPDHRVYLLELHACPCTDKENMELDKDVTSEIWRGENFFDEGALKYHWLESKYDGIVREGIIYKTFSYCSCDELRNSLYQYLINHNLRPGNSIIIFFPIIQDLRYITDILQPYPTLVDVVDNQISWAQDDKRRCFVLSQYFSLLHTSKYVVFNSENVSNFFADRYFTHSKQKLQIIPNWYTLPDSVKFKKIQLADTQKHIFYSGNMNDRIDWDLLHEIAKLPGIRLHLAGTAHRASEMLESILSNSNVIYHGVLQESDILYLLQFMDASVVPHTLDNVSIFMDPIKIKMYSVVGMTIFCKKQLGITGKNIINYGTSKDCLNKIIKFSNNKVHIEYSNDINEKKYLNMINEIRKNKNF